MARTSTPLSCLVFHSIFLGISAISPRECIGLEPATPSAHRSWAALEAESPQGLALLQITSKKLRSDRENSTWFSRFQTEKELNDSFRPVEPLQTQQVDLPHNDDDLELGNESGQYVRFLAQHKQWRDFIDFYKDGFFQRFFSNEAGTWTIKNGKIILDWLQGGIEELHTSDLGRSFVRGEEFELRSHYVPTWFEEQLKKNEAKEEVPEWTYEYVGQEDQPEGASINKSISKDDGPAQSMHSVPTQSYSAEKEDLILKHEVHARRKADWKCYLYNSSAGENDAWCKQSPKRDGYEYAYNGGLFHECGSCWCCSRKESESLVPLPDQLEQNTSEVQDLEREEQAAIEAAEEAARKAEEAAKKAGEEERAAEEADAAAAAAAAKALAAAHKAAQEGERADETEFTEKRVALEAAAAWAAANKSVADAKLKKAAQDKAIAAEARAAKEKAAAQAAAQRAAAEEKVRKDEEEKSVAAEEKAAQEEANARAAEKKAIAEEALRKAEEEKAIADEKQSEVEAAEKSKVAQRKAAAKKNLDEEVVRDLANKKKALKEEEEAKAAALKAQAEAERRKAAKAKARAEAREALEKAAKTKTATDAKLRQLAAQLQQRQHEVEAEAAVEEREAEEKEAAAKQMALKRLADSKKRWLSKQVAVLEDEVPSATEAKKADWQCYIYNKTAGENDEWCMRAPKRAGYEFSYNGGLSRPCNGCWCCTRKESGTMELAQSGDRRKKEKAQQHALALSIRAPWSFW